MKPRSLVLPALLLLVTGAVYAALGLAGFVWDDVPLVLENELTGKLAHLPDWFRSDLWAGAGQQSGYYRPLMLASLALDRWLWGPSTAGHHLHSVAWHLLASGLFFGLLRQLVRPLPALAGAALFALHPLQSEPVAWIAARNDLMAASFVFAATWVMLPERVRPARLFAGGLLLLAALLSKESAVLAPALLVLLDLARWRRLRNPWRYAVPVMATGAWWGLRQLARLDVRDLPSAAGLALLSRRWPQVVALYTRLLAWPWPLSTGRTIEYLHMPAAAVAGWWVAGMLAAGLLLWRGRGLAAAGLGFALVAFAPALVAIAAKGQLGERYVYLPMAGLGLALASALPDRRALPFCLAPVLAGWVLVLHHRLPEWQNGVSLWRAAAEDTPNPYSFAGCGHAVNRAGLPLEAGDWFVRALQGSPPYVDVCSNAIRAPLRAGRADLALRNAGIAQEAGCEPTPYLMGIYASVLAQNGLWERARAVLPQAKDDPSGRAPLVEAALALRDGDRSGYERARALYAEDPAVFDEQVQAIIRAGGGPDTR